MVIVWEIISPSHEPMDFTVVQLCNSWFRKRRVEHVWASGIES